MNGHVKSYDISSMLIGDLHFYHWSGDTAGANHVAIAVAYLSDGETLVDAHNTDSYHVRCDPGASGATCYLDRMHNTINFY
jgi:Putative amidase domain